MFSKTLHVLLILISVVLLPATAHAQCFGLPSVTALGSNKFPVGLCSPVQANVTYTITFTSPVPTGTLELVYDWGDGTPQTIIPLTTGSRTYNASEVHTFPAESNCDYAVVITMRYNGELCSKTNQTQKISSWRTDQFNGGSVQLVSPISNDEIHWVCEGENVDVIFRDATEWNCNASGNSAETPNNEYRWQQIVYNTPVDGNRIPNVKVDGVPVTGPNGTTIYPNYQDPRGVFFMSAPVLIDDYRKRPSLRITADGGFGDGLPKAGNEFAVTLRYWNFCNPYDDPEIPGPPSDVINGDHQPVESKALIRILAPPAILRSTDQIVCPGTTPSAFTVAGVSKNNIVTWYNYITGSDQPGAVILTGKSALPITSHPLWKNNMTPGVYRVWATQKTNIADATNCESPPVLVTRVIRENLVVPNELVSSIPTELCNGQSVTITFPKAATEPIGGASQYTWIGSPGLIVSASTETSATVVANVTTFDATLSAARTLTVRRQYENSPACSNESTVNIKIYQNPVGGVLHGNEQVCEKDSVGPINVSGHTGSIARWEMKRNEESYRPYAGVVRENSISPGHLQPGSYWFRAVVKNGTCSEIYSDEKKIVVSANPPLAQAGDDQFICSSFSSSALNANDPGFGTGTWSYISSVPSGLPAPSFDLHNPNTTVVIQSANAGLYTMRWTISNGSCTSYDDVVVDFGTDPTEPNAGNDKFVCDDTVSLEGNAPTKGQGRWTLVQGPEGCTGNACVTIVSPTSPTSEVILRATPRYGAYTFRWSISSGGNNCFLKSDDVTITFQEPVMAIADDVNGICLDSENLSSIELEGTVKGPFINAQWINITGDGSMGPTSTNNDDGGVTVKSFYNFSQKDYEEGVPIQVKLVTTPANASCTLSEKIISINFEKKQIANAGVDIENSCDQDVQLNATAPLSGAGIWTTTQPGVTFDNNQDPKTIVRNLPVGETTLTWTIPNTGGICESVSSSIVVTRVALPQTTDRTISECATENGNAQIVLVDYENSITPLAATSRNILWYKNSPPPSGVRIDNPSVPMNVSDGQEFFAHVQDVNTGCSSNAKVTINVRARPLVMNTVISQCEDVVGSSTASGIDLNDTRFTQAITTESNVSITWHYSNEEAATGVQPIQENVSVHEYKQFFGRVVYNDPLACSNIAKLDVLVNPIPNIGKIVGRESVCQGQPTVPGNFPVEIYQVTPQQGAEYHWQIPADTKLKIFGGGGLNDFYILLQFPEVYTGKIGVAAVSNGCTSAVVEKEITVDAAPAKPVINGDAIVCSNESFVRFTVTPNNFPSSAYNWDIHRASDNSPGGATIMEGQLTGNVIVNFEEDDVIIFVRENNSECTSPVATKVISVMDPPQAQLVVTHEITAFELNDGAIKTEVTGGVQPYTKYTLLQTGAENNSGIFDHLSEGSYSVQVTDANGCSATSNVVDLEQPFQDIKASFTATPFATCFPATIYVQNLSIGADIYQWKLFRSGKLVTTSNLQSPDFKTTEPGEYDIYLTVTNSITKKSDEFNLKGIRVFDVPHAVFELRNEVIYASDTQVEVINFSTGATQYAWNFGDGFTSTEFEPKHQYQKEGRYLLTLSSLYDHGMVDNNGDGTIDHQLICYDSMRKEVVVINGGGLKIPNAFTPNTDGPNEGPVPIGSFNDIFLPVGNGITEFEMLIYDRWGTLIFESKNKDIGWDGYDRQGKLMPAGVYVYKVVVRLSNGERISRLGDVTIIR